MGKRKSAKIIILLGAILTSMVFFVAFHNMNSYAATKRCLHMHQTQVYTCYNSSNISTHPYPIYIYNPVTGITTVSYETCQQVKYDYHTYFRCEDCGANLGSGEDHYSIEHHGCGAATVMY